MRFLLDSHVVAWLEFGRAGSPGLMDQLGDPEVDRVVSAVTPLEIATKVRLGRWDQAGPLLVDWVRVLGRLQAQSLPISHEHALLAGVLDWDHRDPFDRLLVAQAQVEGLTLLTADRAILSAPHVSVLAWT